MKYKTTAKELKARYYKIVEVLKKCRLSLEVYVNGGNPNSPYKDGKHFCYVLGSREALEQAKQALAKASEL